MPLPKPTSVFLKSFLEIGDAKTHINRPDVVGRIQIPLLSMSVFLEKEKPSLRMFHPQKLFPDFETFTFGLVKAPLCFGCNVTYEPFGVFSWSF